MSKPIIDPKFQKQLNPLTVDELELLEADIVERGVINPLIVWKEKNILLDGHNRLAACLKHNLTYHTMELTFNSRSEAADWIDKNQLGRRNLTKHQFKLIIGRRYNRAKKAPHRPTGKGGKNYHLKTAEFIGIQHGVSEKTVRNAGEFAAEVEASPELKEKVNRGEKVITKKKEPKPKVEPKPKKPAWREKFDAFTCDAQAVCVEAIQAMNRITGIEPGAREELSRVRGWIDSKIKEMDDEQEKKQRSEG